MTAPHAATPTPHAGPTPHASTGNAWLAASAMALVGLIMTAAAWPGGAAAAPPSAMTAVASEDFALLTADGGTDDILIVLDQRKEELLTYQPRNGNALEFKGRYDLRQLFVEARVSNGLRPTGPGTTPAPVNPSR